MNVSQLKSDVYTLCGATSASYPDADLIRNLNVAYNDVARLIWDSADGWSYQDSNQSGYPIATTTLTHGTQDVTIPTTAQRLRRVEVKDSSGNWHKLEPIDDFNIKGAQPEVLGGNPGLPLYYDLAGRTARFFPSPHSGYVSLTSGAAFYFDKDVTEFAVTATTTTPGFATSFHRILSLSASMDFVQDPTTREFLSKQRQRYEDGLARFYARRSVEYPSRIQPSNRKNWRKYL